MSVTFEAVMYIDYQAHVTIVILIGLFVFVSVVFIH